jgi:AraC-like DNA-binding protein
MTYRGITVQLSDSPIILDREIHTYHEILYCIECDAILHTENQQERVKGERLLMIPKGCYHFFEPLNRERFARLKISVPDEMIAEMPLKHITERLRVAQEISPPVAHLLKQICGRMREEKTDESVFYVYHAVLLLLAELNRKEHTESSDKRSVDATVLRCIDYISQNLSKELNIEQLAKAVVASPSYITHIFKREMGISVHRYIVQKRMILARDLLLSGEHASKIYADCGYRDYSSFYKAYVRIFGFAPSEKVEK